MNYKVIINRSIRNFVVKPFGIRWKSTEGGGEMTSAQIAAKLDLFTESVPTVDDYVVLGITRGTKKAFR